jgi:glycosyltransferase involved in cell wall biosynthesis
MSSSKPLRVAILQPAPASYRLPAFNALSRLSAIDLSVHYLSRDSWPHGWSVDHSGAEFVHYPPRAGTRIGRMMEVLSDLARRGADVTMIGGWSHLAYHAVLWSRPRFGTRVVVWTASVDRPQSSLVKDSFKRLVLKHADGVVAASTAAIRYCNRLAPGRSDRMVVALNPVDNSRFTLGTASLDLGYPRPVFLYVGRLDPGKGLADLLRAWLLSGLDKVGSLVLVGEGTQREALLGLSSRLGHASVLFPGYVPYERLPRFYCASDAFVFPSHSDTWGMALNEAMAAGLPIITTSATGAIGDLVVAGGNGLVVPPSQPARLGAAIRQLGTDESLRRRMGRESLRLVERASPSRWADQVARLLDRIGR